MMNTRKSVLRIFSATLICLCLFACSKVTQENFEKIKPNMPMKEVIALLGEPTSSESINIAGISGTSAVWKDKNAEIDIQFLNDMVAVKSYSKAINDKSDDKQDQEHKKQ